MEALLKRQPIDPNQVQAVLVAIGAGSVVDNSDPPDINIQYAMAVMLIDKTATFRSIHDKPRMQDPAILRCARRCGSKRRQARWRGGRGRRSSRSRSPTAV